MLIDLRKVAGQLAAAAGGPVTVRSAAPVRDGWTGQFGSYDWVLRCAVDGPSSWGVRSVIVKGARPDGGPGRGPGGGPGVRNGVSLGRERAALTLLAELGSDTGPRLLASAAPDPGESDFLVLEDLGGGPALDDLLVGSDPDGATRGFVALARALGRMHAATSGHQDRFYAIAANMSAAATPATATTGDSAADSSAGSATDLVTLDLATLDLATLDLATLDLATLDLATLDLVSLAGTPLIDHWRLIGDLASPGAVLPPSSEADGDVASLISWMTAEPLLALTNGDVAPQNSRLGNCELKNCELENCRLATAPGSVATARLLDFEAAHYQHVMLDVAHLRLPFYGGPCWSRIPAEVGHTVEAAYRDEFAIPDRAYVEGMAAATAAWAVVRLVRLPKLVAADPPHPMGFSRRGQLLDTLTVAIDAIEHAGTLPQLHAWLDATRAELRRQWPHLPVTQPLYPAYRRDNAGYGW